MNAAALQHAGDIAKIMVEGDHGAWSVTVIWGAHEPFRGIGATLDEAYRGAINAIVLRANEQHCPGVHDLGTELTPSRFDRQSCTNR